MSKVRCIIYRSTLSNLQTRQKAKKYPIVGTELSINDNTKIPEI